MYVLIIWYREKPDEEIKRYSALLEGIDTCLDIIKKYEKVNIVVEAIIQNDRVID